MKRKQKPGNELSTEMWLLILLALPFIILHWYIDGRYEKQRELEAEKSGENPPA